MLKTTLTNAIETATNLTISGQPVLVHGAPGIGKSKGFAEGVRASLESTIGKPVDLVTFLPSHKDPVAINGLPVPDIGTQSTHTLPSEPFATLLQPPYTTGERAALLFVDEIGQLSPSQQPPIFELIQNRRTADRQLPDSVYIIAATNRRQDAALTATMATPLRNRFAHIELTLSTAEWLDTYLTAAPYPTPIKNLLDGFLRYKPEALLSSEEAAKDPTAFAFATPRSWDALARTLTRLTANNQPLNADTAYTYATALLGKSAAADFSTFVEVASQLPPLKDIEAGKSPTPPESPAARYALASAVSSRLQELANADHNQPLHGLLTARDNLLAYIIRHLPRDMTFAAMRQAVKSSPAVARFLTAKSGQDTENSTIAIQWLTENRDLMA